MFQALCGIQPGPESLDLKAWLTPAIIGCHVPESSARAVQRLSSAPAISRAGLHRQLSWGCRAVIWGITGESGFALRRLGPLTGTGALGASSPRHRMEQKPGHPLAKEPGLWSLALRSAAHDAPNWCTGGLYQRISPDDRQLSGGFLARGRIRWRVVREGLGHGHARMKNSGRGLRRR